MRKEYTWTQANGHPYVGSVVTRLNPGAAFEAASKSAQTLDSNGNLLQSQVFGYGNLTTPARTYNFTYLGGTNYTSRYILNRMATATVTAGGTTYGLAQNTYDEPIPGLTLGAPAAMHDDANYGTGMTYRGNVTTKKTPSGTSTFQYFTTGVLKSSTGESGVTVNNTVNSSTNY